MRVFDKTKTTELTDYDIEKGYLRPDIIETEIPEQEAVEEVCHYEVIKTYKNGGKDVKKVVDVEARPYLPAHTSVEEILVYIPYTEKELERMSASCEISELKASLRDTDYRAIKFAEGVLTAEEYAPDKAKRQAWRERIGELEIILQSTSEGGAYE